MKKKIIFFGLLFSMLFGAVSRSALMRKRVSLAKTNFLQRFEGLDIQSKNDKN
ncbi:MAG: hypothetical protein UR26_C0003G0086 [candidate division TM6 bacterium GW2011_GWF2_32_72]|nr:MAG: hypothetical protein UR26_C0003G0086 [candidate division TM6 bacterium GW2011_GWF2_32_72]